jgi:hypothetical protein
MLVKRSYSRQTQLLSRKIHPMEAMVLLHDLVPGISKS